MNDLVIRAHELSKKFISYKKEPGIKGTFSSFFKRDPIEKYAVNRFELEIKKGEIIGLLGPNGAGKTTLMKMFTGIIVPSSGELTIMGHRPSDRNLDFRRRIALVMGQKSQLWWDIPAMDSFLLLQKYYEVNERNFKDRIEEMGTLLNVTSLFHIHVRKLSLGERMKLELMASLLHNPDVIFLDEPTIGLDLVAQESIRSFVKKYHQNTNCTLILTSHYMQDVLALCKRLVLIFDGKKGYDGPINDFEKILGNNKTVSFNFSEKQNHQTDFWKQYNPIWNDDFTGVEIQVPEESIREIGLEVLKNFPITDFQTEKMPIERVMKTLMSNPEILREKSKS